MMLHLQAAADIQAALSRLPQPKAWSAPAFLPAVYVLDERGQCYFADHDAGSLHPSGFTPLRLDFLDWLQLADLMGQVDALLDVQDDLSTAQIAAFVAYLAQLHPDLPEVFPFKL